MKNTIQPIRLGNGGLTLAICITVASLLALFFRAFMDGDGPTVLADEYIYAAQAKSIWLHQPAGAHVPMTGNWLYLLLMSTGFAFNASYFTIARLLNVISIALAGLTILLTFRRLSGVLLAVLATLACTVLFGGGYAKLFLPEAMQFAMVVLAICAFQKFGLQPSLKRVALLGVIIGCGGLVKVHAFLLTPCFLVGIGLVAFIHRAPWRVTLKNSAFFLLALFTTAYVVRLAVSGNTDFNLLGDFYGDVAKESATDIVGISAYSHVLRRHLATIFLAFSPSIAIAFVGLLGFRREVTPINIARCTLLVLALAVAGMILVTVAFTVSVANSGPHESLDRIHGRYYEHLLILAATLSGLCAAQFMRESRAITRWIVPILLAACLMISMVATKHFGWQNPNDFVSVFGLYWVPSARGAAFALGITALALLPLVPSLAGWIGVLVLATTLTFSATEYDKLMTGLPMQNVEKAAEFVAIETQNSDARVLVASPQVDTEVYRAAFYLLRQPVSLIANSSLSGESAVCPINEQEAKWLVVISQHPLDHCDGIALEAQFNGVAVYSRIDQPGN